LFNLDKAGLAEKHPVEIWAMTNACAILVTEEKAKELNSQATAYLTEPSPTPTPRETEGQESSTQAENAAAGVMIGAGPLQTALAAAAMLGWLMM
jgi:hypothetical protein